jgi:hypothetical protein
MLKALSALNTISENGRSAFLTGGLICCLYLSFFGIKKYAQVMMIKPENNNPIILVLLLI